MRDEHFGGHMLRLREQAGLSQSALGAMAGVSAKTVSRWEKGGAKPGIQHLRKLAEILNVSLDELLSLLEERTQKDIKKIVITGGPCAGKTTALSWIQNAFTARGYAVLFVAETASELIVGGVTPARCQENIDFQRALISLQMHKELVYEQVAETLKADKVLIVCDRGILDNKAYMTENEFQRIAKGFGRTEVALRDEYDAVFHLVTAAKGAQEAYTLKNNEARTETLEEAAALDDRLIAAWTGHPRLRVIDNSVSFETKLKTLIAEIAAFLGDPEPLEIERKFLIAYPDLAWLRSQPNCTSVEIIQTYLKAKGSDELRVRQRGINGAYIYYLTHKRKLSDVKRVEVERRLTKDEYLRLLMEADTTKRQIRKTRYCLTYEHQYFEIDIFPFWQDQAILEIELRREDTEIVFPKEIQVIREVTSEPAYRSAALADITQ